MSTVMLKKKLSEVCEINPRRSATSCADDADTCFIPMNAVDDQTGSVKEVLIRPFAEISKGYTYFQTGDVIFAKITPCMQNGKHAVVPELIGGFGFGSTEFHVLRPTLEVLPEWIYYFVRQPSFLKQAEGSLQGAVGQQRVPASFLAEAELPVPDLPIQAEITAKMKDRFHAVESARKEALWALKALGPLLNKMILDAFHGIIPLSVGRDEPQAPEGWRWHLLLDLARQESGHTPSRRSAEYWADGDIPWLALPDIRALDCQVATQTSEKTNATGITNSSARLLPADTVALCRTASVGYVTIFGREMATSQHFANYICGPNLHPKFLMWLFRSSRAFVQSKSLGSVLPDVYMNVIHQFRVCLPDLPTQQKIAARLDEAFRTIQQLQSAHKVQLEALDKLPGAYLREAFGSLTY
jgi:type I restriction enzyme S subunit